MSSAIKVGDVVAWASVPDGALVRDSTGAYFVRLHGDGHCVGLQNDSTVWESWAQTGGDEYAFDWTADVAPDEGPAIIVALGLTGQESADDLRRLAELFEVREHLMNTGDDAIWYGQDIDELAPRLRAAGWRPGDSAEDAARLLAGLDGRAGAL